MQNVDVIAQTARLVVRKLRTDDAAFVLALLNDPDFLRFIGDRSVRTLADARDYIVKVPMASYERHGFGHYLVELKTTAAPIGLCSLVRREWLEDVDLGFALLPAFRRAGYAFEAASAVLAYARAQLGLRRVVAIASPENAGSVALLRKLGFVFDRTVRPPDEARDLRMFASDG